MLLHIVVYFTADLMNIYVYIPLALIIMSCYLVLNKLIGYTVVECEIFLKVESMNLHIFAL